MTDDLTDDLLEPHRDTGQVLFRKPVVFWTESPASSHLPAAALPEIAFWGRSNVGKSSLINALCAQGALARTSSTPGRTQSLIFFKVGETFALVDMPGYGYAEAPKTKVDAWTEHAKAYLRGRTALRRVLLLIDGRHGIKAIDEAMMKLLDEHAVSYGVVLTKMDALGPQQARERLAETEERARKHVAAYPLVLATSSGKRTGLEDVRAFVAMSVQS